MKKVLLFSFFLLAGLVTSQILPHALSRETYDILKGILDTLMFICLSYIMINVGREFELDQSKWRSYVNDYFIAMATAAAPWIFVAVYFMLLLPSGYFGDWNAWKENLLLSRFAAPTSAGILFTMLAAAGLRNVWIYKKTQTLAIFDDLDTILLMIPLQILMIGFKWQLLFIIVIVGALLWLGWAKLGRYAINQSAGMLIIYSVAIVFVCQAVYVITKKYFGPEGGIHIEVLLPAFVLGMLMKPIHSGAARTSGDSFRLKNYLFRPMAPDTPNPVSDTLSYIFMFLVGMSTPLFIQGDMEGFQGTVPSSITASQPMMSWGLIALHVVLVTLLSNIGKLFPLFFYRDRKVKERLALSVGMFTRGEVGAGIIIIALGYNLGGPALIIAILSLVLNLILTGGFVVIVKRLAIQVYGKNSIGV